jgi:chitodextrinase
VTRARAWLRSRRGRRTLLSVWALGSVGILLAGALVPFLPASSIATTAAAGDPVIAAAGDIACDPTNTHYFGGAGDSNTCNQRATSDMLVNGGYAAVLPLGDNQYYCGGLSAFDQSYDPSWGRVKSMTHPVVGNHEYLTSGGTGCDPSNAAANGYFSYFGSAAGQKGQGWYSYDIGTWHLVALNSNCGDAGGCGSGTPQYNWLSADLAAHQNTCTLAYWHIPLFSSGGRAASNMRSLWALLYSKGADLVLEGHDHIYERFAPQTSTGVLDNALGIRSFIVGTGGANHTSIATIAANSQVRDATTFGILQLTLHPSSYDWKFLPVPGKTFSDTGTGACHGSTTSSDTTPPSVPQGLTASAVAGPAASLTWTASTDNVGVTSYGVFRNGTSVGSTSSTSFTDSTVTAGATYQYTVNARDAAGNVSGQSAGASVTIPPSGTNTFTPTADAYIWQAKPNNNYGTSSALNVDGSPAKRALLRFHVSGVGPNGVASAKLRLYVSNPSAVGGDIRAVTGSWTESGVTWNTSPAFGSTLGSLGRVSSGVWYEVNVAGLVTGNGDFSFGIVSTSSDGVAYVSREGTAAQRPQLVVTPNP